MKRFKSFLILFILLLNIFFVPVVNAASLGTISGNYSFGDVKLDDVDVSLYLVATLDTSNGFSYKYIDDFKEFELDVNSLNYGELEQYVLELEKNIKDNSISAIKKVKTNNDGKFNFKDVDEGLYLVNIEDVERENNIYKSSPSLLFVPNYDSTAQAYNHDVSVNIKTELVKKEDNSNINSSNGSSKIKLPNTYDSIVLYIIGFVVSLILLIILVLFIVYNRRRSNSDEKKNK
ncbi:MAG: hypothetical protein HFE81_03620 [Bacilli bacterium]|nr:hypothetical protein [Bacilli bacterium]